MISNMNASKVEFQSRIDGLKVWQNLILQIKNRPNFISTAQIAYLTENFGKKGMQEQMNKEFLALPSDIRFWEYSLKRAIKSFAANLQHSAAAC